MAEDICYFEARNHCSDKNDKLIESGRIRIQNLIGCSKQYGDKIHEDLQKKIQNDPSATIKCHKTCVSLYILNAKKNLKRKSLESETLVVPPKKTRSSTDTSIFSFKQQCLFCGDRCDVEKDQKHPNRWRRAYVCRKVGTDAGNILHKDVIVKVCNERNDAWGEAVRLRVEGALSDLHAADARYHANCKTNFLTPKSVDQARARASDNTCLDKAFEDLVREMKEKSSKSWNSVELFETYSASGGVVLSRKTLMKNIGDYFGDEILVLYSEGLASIVMFRDKAAKTVRLAVDEDEQMDIDLDRLSKRIAQDIKSVEIDRRHYDIGTAGILKEECASQTLLQLMVKLSPKLDRTVPAVFIASLLTGVVKSRPTGIQVALGVKMARSKQLVNLLHGFGVTCSYDEVLRFKRSAAQSATKDLTLTGISDANCGLVQIVADNFDADISSQNGKSSTHSLAVLITQPMEVQTASDNLSITRISKSEMTEPLEYDVDILRYNGPKKPTMPETAAVRTVLPLKLLCLQTASTNTAKDKDMSFLKDILLEEGTPEYNGYNTALSREKGHEMKPKTKATYLPLIDMKPSHPDTMMTAMRKAQEISKKIGQKHVVFTCDLQLYKVATDIKWAYPQLFENVILRLGGMHSLMSFIGAIGTLMSETGLSEILGEVFGGVQKMLIGKKIPQNLRALRLVAEEMLRGVLTESDPSSNDDLETLLGQVAQLGKTAKLWVEVFITPVLIAMLYVRAEREGDWLLHLKAYRAMMPYFFAAGHINYARYGVCYINAMEQLPKDVLGEFLKGKHVMRHEMGIWNGLWSDMFIETTFMRYGHAPGGIIGITLKPETLKVWALSLHACSQLEANLDEVVVEKDKDIAGVDRHKEEGKARKESDSKDRDGIKQKLLMCIDPFDRNQNPGNVVNIVTGELSKPDVNVYDSYTIGKEQMKVFEEKLPEGFHEPIRKRIVTLDSKKTHVKIGQQNVYDTDVICSRVLGLQASGREVDIHNVISHELAPVPTALFDDTGDLRIAKSKASLKRQLQSDVSDRVIGKVDVDVIDGSALLWVIPYPAEGLVSDYLNNVKCQLAKRLSERDVYLVFDRYYDYSTKCITRSGRAGGASRVFQLTKDNKLPAQKILLTVTENKKHLINLIVSDIIDDKEFGASHTQNHSLMITGENENPVQIHLGHVIERPDIGTKHEEADNILIQQVLAYTKENQNAKVTVVSDDTDVFVLLLHYYHKCNLSNMVLMESPIKGRSVIDIARTVEQHRDIVGELLAAHAITGCDTVASCYGIGKVTAVKVLKSGKSLSLLGCLDSNMDAVIAQATVFIAACDGHSNSSGSMSDTRVHVWGIKSGKCSSAKLCSLPPTSEAFAENVKRAHYQATVWRSLENNDPPELDPTHFGWKKEPNTKSLLPVMLPDDVNVAPSFILKLIRCGCKSATPCSTRMCNCKSAYMACTMFCSCAGQGCNNRH